MSDIYRRIVTTLLVLFAGIAPVLALGLPSPSPSSAAVVRSDTDWPPAGGYLDRQARAEQRLYHRQARQAERAWSRIPKGVGSVADRVCDHRDPVYRTSTDAGLRLLERQVRRHLPNLPDHRVAQIAVVIGTTIVTDC